MNNLIEIQTIIEAPKEFVWECYTQPQHITQWNFADESWHCPYAENDLAVSGKFIARMEAKDGSYGFDFEAIYDFILNYDTINYTMTDERKVFIKFTENDKTTHVQISFEPESENPKELQKQGWSAILNNFKKYVESIYH